MKQCPEWDSNSEPARTAACFVALTNAIDDIGYLHYGVRAGEELRELD